MDLSTPASDMDLDLGKRPRTLSSIQAIASAGEADGRASTHSEGSDVCWICLDGARRDSPLTRACACPRLSHESCRARWQLQSAGSRKETHCEFCDLQLPDWKRTLTPHCGAAAPAVMNVNFDGRTYSFEVKPGIEGYRQFTEAIRRAFSLPEDSELNITFTCDEPATGPVAPPVLGGPGSLLTLQGAGAYDAAVHCASVSAARRLQHGGGVGPASPVAGGGGGTPLPPLSPASASGRGPAIPPAGGALPPPSPPPGTWTRAPASALSPGRRAPGAERAERGAGGLAAAGPPPADPSASSAEGGARHNRGLLGRRLRDLLNFKN